MSVGSQAVRSHAKFQRDEANVLMLDLLNDKEDYVMAIERYSCSVVSIIGWGRRIDRKNDYVVQQALMIMDQGVNMQVPGAYWAETIPELQYLPSWLYPLPSLLDTGATVIKKYFYALTAEGAAAKAPNFAKYLIEAQKEHGLTNEDIAGLTANLIGGGVDTTSSTLISFILACCVFPEAQGRAQQEIDAVVGKERSPTPADESNLPYCAAMLKETFRWRSVTILGGLPHAPIKDDEYRGYRIPANTNITGNLWAIHRRPREFPDPDVFKPERYLEGQRLPYPNERGHNAFGWGRRQCSGQPLAEQGLIMSVIKILWAFNIEPGLDENVSDPTKAELMKGIYGETGYIRVHRRREYASPTVPREIYFPGR
jgi:cytochrome P450